MKTSLLFFRSALILITFSTSSCVIFNKLQYLEPVESDALYWEKGWFKDPLGIKKYSFKTILKDSLNNDIGLIQFEFYGAGKMFAKSHNFNMGLSLETKQDGFMKKIDLDSLNAIAMRDSLKKKGVYTDKELPYRRLYLLNTTDSMRLPMRVSEFFMGYPPDKYRTFRMYSRGTFNQGDVVRIVTGDTFLDTILKRSSFIFRTKKKVDIITRIN